MRYVCLCSSFTSTNRYGHIRTLDLKPYSKDRRKQGVRTHGHLFTRQETWHHTTETLIISLELAFNNTCLYQLIILGNAFKRFSFFLSAEGHWRPYWWISSSYILQIKQSTSSASFLNIQNRYFFFVFKFYHSQAGLKFASLCELHFKF